MRKGESESERKKGAEREGIRISVVLVLVLVLVLGAERSHREWDEGTDGVLGRFDHGVH
jgi:hypothetical protein